MKTVLALFHARNLEFIRDRGALSWNLVVPFILMFSLGVIFSKSEQTLFKVGKVEPIGNSVLQELHLLKESEWIAVPTPSKGKTMIQQHQLDLLVSVSNDITTLWLNEHSPKGQFLARYFKQHPHPKLNIQPLQGDPLRYVDWVLPGILALNMMYSALYGVGYTLLTYRKNGYLKRLSATPITSFQFLLAQILSRLVIVLGVISCIFLGCSLFFDIKMQGHFLSLLALFSVGAFCMTSVSLLLCSRTQSEELGRGLIECVSGSMILFSGIFFTLENSHPLLSQLAQGLPLTHLVSAARDIMLYGAGLIDVIRPLMVLFLMGLACLSLGSALFIWDRSKG